MSDVDRSPMATLSYAQKVRSEYPPEVCKYFVEMLEGHGLEYLRIRNQEPACAVYLVDRNSGEKSRSETFPALKDTDVNPEFVNILSAPFPKTEMRQIVINYTAAQHLNFSFIEAIGSILEIDPLFFLMHFEGCRSLGINPSRDRPPAPLPLESGYLQFSYMPCCHVTLLSLPPNESQGTTVLMLSQTCPLEELRLDSPGPVFLRAMLNSPTPISAPIDCIAPLLEAMASDFATEIERRSEFVFSGYGHEPDRLAKDWKANQKQGHMLDGNVRNLENALRAAEWSHGASPKTKRLHQELAALLKSSKSLSEDIQSSLQQINSVRQIAEAQKGLEQADSVRRLTLVAFVFISLNFATSFFGMNLQQLGTGSINIGFFFLTAALAGGLAFLLSTGIQPLEKRIQRARAVAALITRKSPEQVCKRDLLRYSHTGSKVIYAFTVTGKDGVKVFPDPFEFRARFWRWCGWYTMLPFKWLWRRIRGRRESSPDDDESKGSEQG